jgi:hypothetical protein
MATWYASDSFSVSNGQTLVSVSDGSDLSDIQEGDALVLAGNPPVEIEAVGSSTLSLADTWQYASVTNQTGWVIPTAGSFDAATSALRNSVTQTADMYAAMESWGSDLGTVTFTDYQGTDHTVKTLRQMEADYNSAIAAVGLSVGMREVLFESIREANKQRYRASGSVNFGKHYINGSINDPINEGLFTVKNVPNVLSMGWNNGTEIGTSESNLAVINLAGIEFTLEDMLANVASGRSEIKFPEAPDGTLTYNPTDGTTIQHVDAATAFAYGNGHEPVIRRVDMWGFESWLEEVTSSKPFVYPNGLIQSQATTMDDVPTTTSSRPVAYYAVYDGDTVSQGRGVDFFAATEANQRKILSNPKHNLFYGDDGKLYQWRLRQRTIAGVGNGDWKFTDSTGDTLAFNNISYNFIRPQGQEDVPPTGSYGAGNTYLGTNSVLPRYHDHEKGLFQARNVSDNNFAAVEGHCYFLVCGTVTRLNQGAYHPSFNPFGAGAFAWSTANAGQVTWYGAGGTLTKQPTGVQDCFVNADEGGSKTTLSDSGSIDRGYQARPDGRFYDAIYADGVGGVQQDLRFGVHREGYTPATAKAAMQNGSFRGLQKLRETKVMTGVSHTNSALHVGGTLVYVDGLIDFFGGVYTSSNSHPFWVSSDNATRWYKVQSTGQDGSGDYIYVEISAGNLTSEFPLGSRIVLQKEIDTSVGGEFQQTDIIGDPANILATPALADGWLGGWVPQIPDGVVTNNQYTISRKRVDSSTMPLIMTDNNGVSWSTSSRTWDSTTNANTSTAALPSTRVELWNYTASSYMTEAAVNSRVYQMLAGIGDVMASSNAVDQAFQSLAESLVGKVLTSSPVTVAEGKNILSLVSVGFDHRDTELKLFGYNISAGTTSHQPLTLGAPNNSGPAFKALDYVTEENGLLYTCYAYNELIYDVDWGDDGKIKIADNDSTDIDDNGNTIKVGTHRSALPIGWA